MHHKVLRLTIVVMTAVLFATGVTVVLALATLPQSDSENGAVLCVDDDTCPAVGSGTQLDPYCRIQDAVDAATDGAEIHVAAGVYSATHMVLDARTGYTYTQVVFIDRSLTLRGGYDAHDWNAAPDPITHPTIIDAQRSGRGVSLVGSSFTGIPSVTIDGFTITGGDYTGLGNPPGGGWQVCHAEEGVDCGGGLYATWSSLLLRNSIITDNIASFNPHSHGGGFYALEVPYTTPGIRIENSLIAGNSAPGTGGEGGGIFIDGLHSTLAISHSTLRDNHADGRGGGMRLNNTSWCLVRIEGTDFIRNASQSGPGGAAFIPLDADGDVLTMDRVRFQDNQADYSGAALQLEVPGPYAPRARLTNLLFSGNHSFNSGSGAVLYTYSSRESLEIDIAHVTAAENDAPRFLYALAWGSDHWLTVTLTNTLVFSSEHAFSAFEGSGGQVFIRHTNTLADDVAALHQPVGGDPTFDAVTPLSGDAGLDSSYHLQPDSDAIDAGVATAVVNDLDGDFRPQSVAPDIGADEYEHESVSPAQLIISGPGGVDAKLAAVFLASVNPVTATAPFTFVWQATDQGAVTRRQQGASDSLSFEWDTPGDKTISVTASNAFGAVNDTQSVQVSGVPVLQIGKRGPAEALIGAPIAYTLTITNSGVAAAQSLVVTDAVPSGAHYVSGGTLVGGEVRWNVPSLAANGGVAKVGFVVTATESLTNDSYAVTANGGYSATGTAPVVTVVGTPDLSISKEGPYAANAGDPVGYDLTLINNGTVAATHLVVTDTIPTGATYVSGGTLVGEEVHWTVAGLPPNGGETQVSLVVTADQTITNTDYGVIADGGFGSMGVDPVTTIIGAAGTRFVAPHGVDGLNPCTQSNAPCATLQHTANVAGDGDEIRVAVGTYSGTQMVVDARTGYTYTQVVFIHKDVTLRGGCDVGDWNAAPDPAANVSVIDAQQQGRGISIVGTSTDWLSVTIDGFTVTGGDYTGLGNPPGGGWQVCHAEEGVDCGGGVYATHSSLLLRNSVVSNNVASDRDSSHGGGIYVYVVPPEGPGVSIENSLIAGNSAPGSGSEGGGIFVDGLPSPLTITHSALRDNFADGRGAGLRLVSTAHGRVLVENTDFISNATAADAGGGAFIALDSNGMALVMERVRFLGNRADGLGGAALAAEVTGPYSPRAHLTNLVFGGNRNDSGAVLGVFNHTGARHFQVDMAHITAADNQARSFLRAAAWGTDNRLTTTLTNTLLVSFTQAFVGSEGLNGEAIIRHTNTLADGVITLHHAQDGSPTFEAINPLSGDARLDSTYHLRPGSDAIDAGVDAGVTIDIDGESRMDYAPPDIGADEFTTYRVFLPLVQRRQ